MVAPGPPTKPGWQPEQSSYTPHALALGAESTRAVRARIESAASENFCLDIDPSFLLARATRLGCASVF